MMNRPNKPDKNRLSDLQAEIVACKLCPRLVHWREQTVKEKPKRYSEWEYWAKPVPGFGDPNARLLIVGLAPAAHGANRTGRMFTGDRSGDWLYRALHKFGFASQPHSTNRDDGLRLLDCYITAALRCAPPANKPLLDELNNCRPFLLKELELLPNLRVIVALGQIAFRAILKAYDGLTSACLQTSIGNPKSRIQNRRFAHGLELKLNDRLTVIASYHPSQQNTFTGRLTEPMFDAIFQRARDLLSARPNIIAQIDR